MKTLTAFLLASGLAILTTLSVSAQEQTEQQGFPLATMVTCDTVDNMIFVITDKYQERPLVIGKGSMFAQNGQMMVGNMTLWANPSTSTFSVTLDNGTIMCMVNSGTEFAPAAYQGSDI